MAEQSPGYVDAENLAHDLFDHASSVHGDADADMFLARVISELLEMSPVAREHICDLLLGDLVEELHRHGEPGRDAARLVGVVQRDWANDA